MIGREGRGCHKCVPVLGGDGTKISPTGDIFDQSPGEMSRAVVQRLRGRGRGCHKFVPVLGGDGTKISPTEGIFDQSPGEMSRAVVQRLRGRGRGCHKFVPVLGGDGTKISPTGYIFDQFPGEMSRAALFNDWRGGGGDVTNLPPFWEGTARKYPLPGIYLTNPLVK